MTGEAKRSADTQHDVVAFLSDPATHGGNAPVHLETHLSHVFLVADRALKLKKPVRWSVVDYADVGLREHFCRREIEVNRPFAERLYRGVIPITHGPNGFALGGEGPAVDFVVDMVRFPDGAQLDQIVDDGRATPALVDATADTVAAMHAAVPARRTPGRQEAENARIDQLAGDLAPIVGPSMRRGIEDWRRSALAAVRQHGPLIKRRGRHGFVRRCHGDLHLSNICVFEGRPCPFDALEFSEELATIDLLYDLTFVLVDLDLRYEKAYASRLLSRYLENTRDYSGLAILPLYRSMRAMVRALVGAAKGRDPEPAIRYAVRSLATQQRAQLMAIGGLSGSGKTTVARALAALDGAVIVRSDTTRKRLFGVAPEAPLPQEAYAATVSDRIHRRMLADARRALVAGWPVILDATFRHESDRDHVEAFAAQISVPFRGVWLDVPHEELFRRVAQRFGDASDADERIVQQQLASETGPIRWTRLDGRAAPEHIAAQIAPGEPP